MSHWFTHESPTSSSMCY